MQDLGRLRHRERHGWDRRSPSFRPISEAKPLQYVGVRELQKRGAWHTHLVVLDWTRLDLDEVGEIVRRHGFHRAGFHVKAKRLSEEYRGLSAARYVAKSLGGYLTKNGAHEDEWRRVVAALPEGQRLVTHSRDFAPGRTLLSVAADRAVAMPGTSAAIRQGIKRLRAAFEARYLEEARAERLLLELLEPLGATLVPAGPLPGVYCPCGHLRCPGLGPWSSWRGHCWEGCGCGGGPAAVATDFLPPVDPPARFAGEHLVVTAGADGALLWADTASGDCEPIRN
jgi:hypothetical protein